jgi:hypothetical protein
MPWVLRPATIYWLFVIVLRKPKKYSKAIAGMSKDIYASSYLDQEGKAGASR